MKYLVLIAVVLLVYLLWRHQRAQEEREESAARPPAAPPPPALPPQDMVRCPVCGVHLPREDAVADPRGRLYCSPEHRRIGANQNP